jgi:hypothetical protein
MRKTRVGKRICVHRVPLDTSWFYPYCCATVDTAFVTSSGTGCRTRPSARLTRVLITAAYLIPQRRMYRGTTTKPVFAPARMPLEPAQPHVTM